MTSAIGSALLCLALSGAPLATGVPSAANSTFPPCLVACPMGDIHVVVIVRDLANNPLNGASVVLEFSGCPAAHLCDPQPNDPYATDPVARRVRMFTDATGKADFPLRVGGLCGAGTVMLFANGVLMASYGLASPDQDGDGFTANLVMPNDATLFAAKLGKVDPTADFDCSGGPVDLADQVIFNYHSSQFCLGWVDAVKRSTWGTLKQHYR